jgi:hypothetical protein
MIRGEFSTKVQSMNINSTIVVRDGYSYAWSSAAPTMGFKIKVVENINANGSGDTSGGYSFNAEQIGDYNCEEWSYDISMFALPTNITFKEYGAR